jgi:hypothetical protein
MVAVRENMQREVETALRETGIVDEATMATLKPWLLTKEGAAGMTEGGFDDMIMMVNDQDTHAVNCNMRRSCDQCDQGATLQLSTLYKAMPARGRV